MRACVCDVSMAGVGRQEQLRSLAATALIHQCQRLCLREGVCGICAQGIRPSLHESGWCADARQVAEDKALYESYFSWMHAYEVRPRGPPGEMLSKACRYALLNGRRDKPAIGIAKLRGGSSCLEINN